mmetsp:Transcript_15442/g.19836  ORF Transcript_15442/g.19836 Transcript_15442/m.19836 type:complete len:105 (+) Transcript_15442:238-552(+)
MIMTTTPNITSTRLHDVMKVCVQLHKDIQSLEGKLNARNQTAQELTSRVEKLQTDKDGKEKELYQQVKQLEEKMTTHNHTIQSLVFKIQRLKRKKITRIPRALS